VDFQICRPCKLGWVEQPYTDRRISGADSPQRPCAPCASSILVLAGTILGGHFRDSEPFWSAVGINVPGGYEQRKVCPHRPPPVEPGCSGLAAPALLGCHAGVPAGDLLGGYRGARSGAGGLEPVLEAGVGVGDRP
jgi:hypothetical protein